MSEIYELIEKAFNEEIKGEFWDSQDILVLIGKEEFLNRVKEILESRPTCGKEQRKFLDEIEKEGLYDLFNSGHAINFPQGSFLGEDDFTSDLNKVINGE